MERFARIIVGYHGCPEEFAHNLLLGKMPIDQWRPSRNVWDWLGHGIYFWEHSPQRAMRWARERYNQAAVLGAVIQLDSCFDLLDETATELLAEGYSQLVQAVESQGSSVLPTNVAGAGKLRKLDCLVINDTLFRLAQQGIQFNTVRGAFLEGEPAYPGAGFSRETHIQVSVRNPACILGVFRPNL